MSVSRALVTGGAGFIGSHVAQRLVTEGVRVRILDNLSTGFLHNLSEFRDDIEFIEGDVRDADQCAGAVRGVDTVYHVAALPSVPRSMQDPIGTHESNVNGTLNILEAARRAGVGRFVYSSSSSAYGDTVGLPKDEDTEPLPRSPYAAAKLSGELYTLAYARAGLIEGVALRYFNIFGPRQDPNGPYAAIIPLVFRAILMSTPLTLFGDGMQTRDFTYVDNAVDANLLAATGPAGRVSGMVTNVGGGTRTSLLDLVDLVQEITGRQVGVQFAPPRAGDVRDSQAGLDRAQAILGYEPRVTVREGIERLWAWYAANPAALIAGATS